MSVSGANSLRGAQCNASQGAPVGVHEEDGLRAALLARARVRVLVALPGHVVDVAHVGAQDLPVEARVLDANAAAQVGGQLLRDGVAAGEERVAGLAAQEDVVDDGALAVDVVHVLLRHARRVQHAQELLHGDGDAGVDVQQRLVAHVEGAHELEHGDLDGEVEGRDDGDGAEGEAVPVALLAQVVAGHGEAAGEEADLVPGEVLEEGARYVDLAHRLCVALRRRALDEAGEEVGHRLLRQHGRGAGGDGAVEVVPLHVLERVVHPRGGHALHRLHERVHLARRRRLGHLDERLAGQRVRNLDVLLGPDPLPAHCAANRGDGAKGPGSVDAVHSDAGPSAPFPAPRPCCGAGRPGDGRLPRRPWPPPHAHRSPPSRRPAVENSLHRWRSARGGRTEVLHRVRLGSRQLLGVHGRERGQRGIRTAGLGRDAGRS